MENKQQRKLANFANEIEDDNKMRKGPNKK